MEEQKVNYKRYFDIVDAALATTFKQHPSTPIVLAGAGYLLPIYRRANTSGRLLEEEVHGNQDRATLEDIHKASWGVAGPYFERATEAVKDRFRRAVGHGNRLG